MINRQSERALYRQVADLLRDKILAGEYAPGEKLPTADTLARRHEVGFGVAAAALSLLRSEGLIDTSKGKASWVRVQPERRVVRIQRGSTWVSRPATAAEREKLGLRENEHVVEVTHGARVACYAENAVVFTFS